MTTRARTRKSPAKKPAAKKSMSPGDSYVCGVCGLAVTVENPCDCEPVCDITCCGEPLSRVATSRAGRK
jgi:rubrerythrin